MTVLCNYYEISDLLMSMNIRSNISISGDFVNFLQGPLGIRRWQKTGMEKLTISKYEEFVINN